MIQKLLIANRAEIASRIIRSAKQLGITSVALYSDADARLPFVEEADEAYYLGPSQADQSYLSSNKILAIAQGCGADAIHPGYGFLSEDPRFSRSVQDAGLIFVGPSPEAMEKLGSKSAAKAIAEQAEVEVVPWFEVPADKSLEQLNEHISQAADQIGYPVILKPIAGGGGKGMYRCENKQELLERTERARREAQAAFGDQGLLVEKFLVCPRHIEVQILADHHGKVLHLYERECSIQRRNQKLIEETPCAFLNQAQREKLCADAVAIAKIAGYTNAGTCEFLYDRISGKWYFCEMNTRLQVEHPITEEVTGVDLVQQQIFIASGEKLKLEQSDIQQQGHSIEFRIIAEDPFQNFAPSLGTLQYFNPPSQTDAKDDKIRNELGYSQGNQLSPFYDSLLAKLIVSGKTRQEAIASSQQALQEFMVLGLQTCIPFHIAMLSEESFLQSDYHIHRAEELISQGFLEQYKTQTRSVLNHVLNPLETVALIAARMKLEREKRYQVAFQKRSDGRGSSSPNGTRAELPLHYHVSIGEDFSTEIKLEQKELLLSISRKDIFCYQIDLSDQESIPYSFCWKNNGCEIFYQGINYNVKIQEKRFKHYAALIKPPQTSSGKEIKAPMPGLVMALFAQEGEKIKAKQSLLTLNAMKLENDIRSPVEGTVQKVHVEAGQAVEKGALLMTLS